MSTIEDRLRAATKAAAGTVTPDSAPPLHLPADPGTSGWRHRPRWARGWPGWLAPVAASAAVIAVVTTSLAVSGTLLRGQARAPTRPASTVALQPAPPIAGGIPAYDVALAPGALDASHSTQAVVRATATGAVLATITPPRPYSSLTWVTGAADDRTFVLAAQPWPRPHGSGPTKFFLLRLDPAAHTARLTPLPIRVLSAELGYVVGTALSPDGGKLAVALMASRQSVMHVFDLASGSVRTWKSVLPEGNWVGTDLLAANPLSWAADGRTLALDTWGRNVQVRLLDTAAPGANLLAGRLVVTFPDWAATGSVSGSATITPDGTKIIAMEVRSAPAATEIRAREFSATTGKQLAVLVSLHYRRGAVTGWPNVLWTSPSGSVLIISTTRLGTGPGKNGNLTPGEIGTVTRGRFAPLPGIPGGQQPVW